MLVSMFDPSRGATISAQLTNVSTRSSSPRQGGWLVNIFHRMNNTITVEPVYWVNGNYIKTVGCSILVVGFRPPPLLRGIHRLDCAPCWRHGLTYVFRFLFALGEARRTGRNPSSTPAAADFNKHERCLPLMSSPSKTWLVVVTRSLAIGFEESLASRSRRGRPTWLTGREFWRRPRCEPASAIKRPPPPCPPSSSGNCRQHS